MEQRLAEAKLAIETSFDRRTSICDPFLSVVPVTGASVSFLGAAAAQETVCASNDIAAHLDELQFDLHEGPCWEAMATNVPALHSDIQSETESVWPNFFEAIRGDDVGAMWAFPLAVASLQIGAVDLYSTKARPLTRREVFDAGELAKVASWEVLKRILGDHEADVPPTSPFSRREVHQATGMIIAQLDITAEDATLLLRAHAFSGGRSVREIANDVVERRLVFTDEPIARPPSGSM